MVRRVFWIQFAVGLLAGHLSAQDDGGRFFPLEVGNAWSFAPNGDSSLSSRYEIIVFGVDGDVATVRYQLVRSFPFLPGWHEDVRLRALGNQVDIELGEEGFGPFYRFQEDKFLHRDFRVCTDDVPVTVASLEESVHTFFGDLEECLLLGFQNRCGDAGILNEWWCPEVGLVEWWEDAGEGPGIWALVSFEPTQKRFLRGDANADGNVDLSDPVATLGVLFLGDGFLVCDDAADANDDGALDLSDAVHTLRFLFAGGPGPSVPGPDECGDDPTEDELRCASFPECT